MHSPSPSHAASNMPHLSNFSISFRFFRATVSPPPFDVRHRIGRSMNMEYGIRYCEQTHQLLKDKRKKMIDRDVIWSHLERSTHHLKIMNDSDDDGYDDIDDKTRNIRSKLNKIQNTISLEQTNRNAKTWMCVWIVWMHEFDRQNHRNPKTTWISS